MASYPDAYVDDGWIWLYYDVTDISSPTTLVASSSALNQFDSSFEIDGVSVAKAQTYQFSTTGEHLVKMKRSGALSAGTFSAITTLKRAYLNSTVTGLTGSNYGGPFYNCTGLTHVKLPEELTSIGAASFKYCSALEVINLDGHSGITTIGQEAFNGSSSMAVEIELPNLSSVSGGAFRNTGITKIIDLGTISSLPNVSSMGFFQGCTNLTEAVLPSTLTSIGAAAFSGCSALITVSIHKESEITSIGQDAFRGCSSLLRIVLPVSLTSINGWAFASCSGLKEMVCYAITPPTLSNNPLGGLTGIQKIYVNPQSVDTYKSATGWSSFSAKIFPLWPETPIAINHLSLGDFRRRIMMGISRPSGYPDPWVDDGKIWAYYNVTTTESATSLCYSTSAVSKMEIDGVEVTKATSYQFATTGEHLVKYTMNGTDIPTRFFRERPVVRVYMPDIIETLSGANGAQFSTCTQLTFVRFSANLTQISYQGFTGCTSLVINNLKLPKLESIGSNGLRRTKTHKITDLGKITAIPSGYVFANISTLEVVILPDTLTSIGDRAFSSSGSSCVLTCLATTPPTLGANVFAAFSCSKVLVPASSVEAYKTAWSGLANKIEAIPTT